MAYPTAITRLRAEQPADIDEARVTLEAAGHKAAAGPNTDGAMLFETPDGIEFIVSRDPGSGVWCVSVDGA